MGKVTVLPPWAANKPPLVETLVRPYMIKKALQNDRSYSIFHPSAWGSCLRKVAYQYYNEAEHFADRKGCDIDLRYERIFDLGHTLHARWQNYLDCSGVLRGLWRCPNPLCSAVYGTEAPLGAFNPLRTISGWSCRCGNSKKLVYEEVRVRSEECYNFDGHCDAIVDLSASEFKTGTGFDLFVVDFKSMKDEMFGELTEAKHEHVVQTNIYMWILDLKAAVVVYENKDNSAIKECFVPRDDAMIEKIKEQAVWMGEMLRNRKIPYRPIGFTRSKYPCRFCEFAEICYR